MWRRGKSRRSARDYKVKLNLKKSKTFHQLLLLFKIQIGGGDLEYKGVFVWGPPCSHTTHTFFLLTKGDPKTKTQHKDKKFVLILKTRTVFFLSFFILFLIFFIYFTFFINTFKLGCQRFEHRLLHITMRVSANWVILDYLFYL